MLFQVHTVKILPDSAWYMSNALTIHNGHGYVDADLTTPIVNRGPAFSWLISLSYSLFGVSVHSALRVVRLFFILNGVILFLLGTTLFNEKTGFCSAVLYAFTPKVHTYSAYILLDNIWPFFFLLSGYLLFYGIDNNKKTVCFAAGISIAVSYLIKETALLMLPAPFFFLLFYYRKSYKDRLPAAVLFYTAFLIPVAVWAAYLFSVNGEVVVTGVRPEALLNESGIRNESGFVELVARLFSVLHYTAIRYFYNFSNSYVYFLLPAAGYAGFRSIVLKDKRDGFIFLLFLSLIPLILLTGWFRLRFGQLLPVYFLATILISRSVLSAGDVLLSNVLKRSAIKRTQAVEKAAALILSISLCMGVFRLNRIPLLAIVNNTHRSVGFRWDSGGIPRVTGPDEKILESAGEWMRGSLPENSRILCDIKGLYPLYFYADGYFRMYAVPLVDSGGHRSGCETGVRFADRRQEGGGSNDTLFLWKKAGSADLSIKSRLYALRESSLLDFIERERISHVVFTSGRRFLESYFLNNPCFDKVMDFETGKVTIYKVRCANKKTDALMQVGNGVAGYFRSLERGAPARYRMLTRDFLGSCLRLSHDEIQGVFRGSYPTFKPD